MTDKTPENAADPPDSASDLSLSDTPTQIKLKFKEELLAILAGKRATQIIRAGGAAPDYTDTLVPADNFEAVRLLLIEALTEVLREIQLTSLTSSGLNHLLDLINDLRPKNAFQALGSYLKLGAKVDSQFVPFGGAVTIDLHEKLLETLEMDFDIPPLNAEDPAFLTYIEILRQQMLNPQYEAYAAFQLIKLEKLQTESPEFKDLVAHDLPGAGKILHNLIMYGGHGYGFADIKSVFHAVLEYGNEGLRVISSALNRSGSRLDLPEFREIPTDHETPRLTLFNGVMIPITLTEEQMFLAYRHDYEVSMEDDLRLLLATGDLDDGERETLLTKLFNKACTFGSRDFKFLTFFEDRIEANGWNLVIERANDLIYVAKQHERIYVDLGEIPPEYRQTFLSYRNECLDIPCEREGIEQTIAETIEQAERAFGAAN